MKPLLAQAIAANEGFARQHDVALTLSAPAEPLSAPLTVTLPMTSAVSPA